MGLLDFFKRKKKDEVASESCHDNSSIQEEYNKQKHLLDQLSNTQKAAYLVVLNSFVIVFIAKDTIHWNEAEELINARTDMLGITYQYAKSQITDGEMISTVLQTIDNKEITSILLKDMKRLFDIVVNMNLFLKDGTERNYRAIDVLNGVFIPLGYKQNEIIDPNDYIHKY